MTLILPPLCFLYQYSTGLVIHTRTVNARFHQSKFPMMECSFYNTANSINMLIVFRGTLTNDQVVVHDVIQYMKLWDGWANHGNGPAIPQSLLIST